LGLCGRNSASGSQSKTTTNETPSRKACTCAERKAARGKPFESKESYRLKHSLQWKAKQAVEQQAQPTQQLQETLEQSEKTRSFISLTEKRYCRGILRQME